MTLLTVVHLNLFVSADKELSFYRKTLCDILCIWKSLFCLMR